MKPNPRTANARWLAVARTLPPGADHDHVRALLEQIAAAPPPSPKQLASDHVRRARLCRELRAELASMKAIGAGFGAQLLAQEQHEMGEARRCEGFWRGSYRLVQQCKILWVWQHTVRGDLHLDSIFPFFAAAHELVFCKRAPTRDALKKVLPQYKQFIAELASRPRLITIHGTEAI